MNLVVHLHRTQQVVERPRGDHRVFPECGVGVDKLERLSYMNLRHDACVSGQRSFFACGDHVTAKSASTSSGLPRKHIGQVSLPSGAFALDESSDGGAMLEG
jgi:hypothetical protein